MRLLIALSALAALIAPASSALASGSGGIGIRLVDVPASAHDDPLAGSYIVDRLAPGTTVRRRIEITNSTRSTADVSVYPAAAGLRRGNFAFSAGHAANELTSWTSVGRDVLRLPPGTKSFTTVTVNVPADAASGERYAVVWAAVSAPAPAGGGVTLVNRVGVRIYLSIGSGGAPPSSFAIGSLSAERSDNGTPLVVAVVHNTGRRTLDITGSLTLTKGPGGLRAGPFPVTLDAAVAPGNSKSATVQLDNQLPRGPWQARIQLRSGSVERAAVATITFPANVVASRKPATALKAPAAAEPGLLIVGLAVLLFMLVAIAAGQVVRVYGRRT